MLGWSATVYFNCRLSLNERVCKSSFGCTVYPSSSTTDRAMKDNLFITHVLIHSLESTEHAWDITSVSHLNLLYLYILHVNTISLYTLISSVVLYIVGSTSTSVRSSHSLPLFSCAGPPASLHLYTPALCLCSCNAIHFSKG